MFTAVRERIAFPEPDIILEPLEPRPAPPPPPPPDGLEGPAPWQPGDPLPWEQPIPGATLYLSGRAGEEDAGIAIHYNDIEQGPVGDCYFMSTVAAIARRNPGEIRNMIRENRDGRGNVTSYTVTLFDKESKWLGLSSKTVRREITIDANFHKWYRAKAGDEHGGQAEVWPLVLEEAYSRLNTQFGDGGWPKDAYFTLTGRTARDHLPYDLYQPAVGRGGGGSVVRAPSFEQLARELDSGKAIMLSTIGNEKKAMANGLVENHAYMMRGYHQDASGRKIVELYNPWGSKIDVPYDDLRRLFRRITIGG